MKLEIENVILHKWQTISDSLWSITRCVLKSGGLKLIRQLNKEGLIRQLYGIYRLSLLSHLSDENQILSRTSINSFFPFRFPLHFIGWIGWGLKSKGQRFFLRFVFFFSSFPAVLFALCDEEIDKRFKSEFSCSSSFVSRPRSASMVRNVEINGS